MSKSNYEMNDDVAKILKKEELYALVLPHHYWCLPICTQLFYMKIFYHGVQIEKMNFICDYTNQVKTYFDYSNVKLPDLMEGLYSNNIKNRINSENHDKEVYYQKGNTKIAYNNSGLNVVTDNNNNRSNDVQNKNRLDHSVEEEYASNNGEDMNRNINYLQYKKTNYQSNIARNSILMHYKIINYFNNGENKYNKNDSSDSGNSNNSEYGMNLYDNIKNIQMLDCNDEINNSNNFLYGTEHFFPIYMPNADTITSTKVLFHKYGLIGNIFTHDELKFIYFENKISHMNKKIYDNLHVFKTINISTDISRRKIDFYFPFFFENTTNVCIYLNNKLLPPNSRLYMTEEEAKNIRIKSYKHDNINNKILCSNVTGKIDCTKTNVTRPLINLIYRKINRKQKVRFWGKYEQIRKGYENVINLKSHQEIEQNEIDKNEKNQYEIKVLEYVEKPNLEDNGETNTENNFVNANSSILNDSCEINTLDKINKNDLVEKERQCTINEEKNEDKEDNAEKIYLDKNYEAEIPLDHLQDSFFNSNNKKDSYNPRDSNFSDISDDTNRSIEKNTERKKRSKKRDRYINPFKTILITKKILFADKKNKKTNESVEELRSFDRKKKKRFTLFKMKTLKKNKVNDEPNDEFIDDFAEQDIYERNEEDLEDSDYDYDNTIKQKNEKEKEKGEEIVTPKKKKNKYKISNITKYKIILNKKKKNKKRSILYNNNYSTKQHKDKSFNAENNSYKSEIIGSFISDNEKDYDNFQTSNFKYNISNLFKENDDIINDEEYDEERNPEEKENSERGDEMGESKYMINGMSKIKKLKRSTLLKFNMMKRKFKNKQILWKKGEPDKSQIENMENIYEKTNTNEKNSIKEMLKFSSPFNIKKKNKWNNSKNYDTSLNNNDMESNKIDRSNSILSRKLRDSNNNFNKGDENETKLILNNNNRHSEISHVKFEDSELNNSWNKKEDNEKWVDGKNSKNNIENVDISQNNNRSQLTSVKLPFKYIDRNKSERKRFKKQNDYYEDGGASLGICVRYAEEPFNKSRIVTFVNSYIFINRLPFDVKIVASNPRGTNDVYVNSKVLNEDDTNNSIKNMELSNVKTCNYNISNSSNVYDNNSKINSVNELADKDLYSNNSNYIKSKDNDVYLNIQDQSLRASSCKFEDKQLKNDMNYNNMDKNFSKNSKTDFSENEILKEKHISNDNNKNMAISEIIGDDKNKEMDNNKDRQYSNKSLVLSNNETYIKSGEISSFHYHRNYLQIKDSHGRYSSLPFSLIPKNVPANFQIELHNMNKSQLDNTNNLLVEVNVCSGLFGDKQQLPYTYNGYFYILTLPVRPQFEIINTTKYMIAYLTQVNRYTKKLYLNNNYDTYLNIKNKNNDSSVKIVYPYRSTYYTLRHNNEIESSKIALKVVGTQKSAWTVNPINSFIDNVISLPYKICEDNETNFIYPRKNRYADINSAKKHMNESQTGNFYNNLSNFHLKSASPNNMKNNMNGLIMSNDNASRISKECINNNKEMIRSINAEDDNSYNKNTGHNNKNNDDNDILKSNNTNTINRFNEYTEKFDGIDQIHNSAHNTNEINFNKFYYKKNSDIANQKMVSKKLYSFLIIRDNGSRAIVITENYKLAKKIVITKNFSKIHKLIELNNRKQILLSNKNGSINKKKKYIMDYKKMNFVYFNFPNIPIIYNINIPRLTITWIHRQDVIIAMHLTKIKYSSHIYRKEIMNSNINKMFTPINILHRKEIEEYFQLGFLNSNIDSIFMIKNIHIDHFVKGDIPVILKNTNIEDNEDVFLYMQMQQYCVDFHKQAPIYQSINIKISPLNANIELLVIEQIIRIIENEKQLLLLYEKEDKLLPPLISTSENAKDAIGTTLKIYSDKNFLKLLYMNDNIKTIEGNDLTSLNNNKATNNSIIMNKLNQDKNNYTVLVRNKKITENIEADIKPNVYSYYFSSPKEKMFKKNNIINLNNSSDNIDSDDSTNSSNHINSQETNKNKYNNALYKKNCKALLGYYKYKKIHNLINNTYYNINNISDERLLPIKIQYFKNQQIFMNTFSSHLFLHPNPRWVDNKVSKPVYIKELKIHPIEIIASIRTSEHRISRRILHIVDALPLDTPSMCIHLISQKRSYMVCTWNSLVQSLKVTYFRQLLRQSLPSAWLSNPFAFIKGFIKGLYALFKETIRGVKNSSNFFDGFMSGFKCGIIILVVNTIGGLFQSLSHMVNVCHKIMGGSRPRPSSILDSVILGLDGLILDTFYRPWVSLFTEPQVSINKGNSTLRTICIVIVCILRCIFSPVFGLLNFFASITEGFSNTLIGDFERFSRIQERTEFETEKEPTRMGIIRKKKSMKKHRK